MASGRIKQLPHLQTERYRMNSSAGNWEFVFILPNLSIKNSVGNDNIAICSLNDPRVKDLIKIHSNIRYLVTGFTDQFNRKVTPSVFKAKNIKTAEAAKVIENIQRDINIALVNELSLIFEKMGLGTTDVLETAATKWNFHRYSPGLVGGHCIPVDPYYLVYKARELGYHPQVILSGRAINDYMAKHVAQMTIKALAGKSSEAPSY